MYGTIWAQRGYRGKQIAHGEVIADLMRAMMIPKMLATVKCSGQETHSPLITRGNNAVDEAAKQV